VASKCQLATCDDQRNDQGNRGQDDGGGLHARDRASQGAACIATGTRVSEWVAQRRLQGTGHAKLRKTNGGSLPPRRLAAWHRSVMSFDSGELRELWESTLRDACIDQADAALFAMPSNRSSAGFGAKAWVRGSVIDDAADVEALGERLAEANSGRVRNLRRVAVWTGGRSREGLAATLRHELEHTVQLEVLGEILQQLSDDAYSVLIEHAGGLPGSGVLYHAIPAEADANAAAARFVRDRFGDARIDELVEGGDRDRAAMRQQNPPEPLETLRDRMQDFVGVLGPAMAKEFADRDPTRRSIPSEAASDKLP